MIIINIKEFEFYYLVRFRVLWIVETDNWIKFHEIQQDVK